MGVQKSISISLFRPKQLHEIRISHELERHAQQMRHEQELQLMRLDEHAKAAAVATSYPIMYKQWTRNAETFEIVYLLYLCVYI